MADQKIQDILETYGPETAGDVAGNLPGTENSIFRFAQASPMASAFATPATPAPPAPKKNAIFRGATFAEFPVQPASSLFKPSTMSGLNALAQGLSTGLSQGQQRQDKLAAQKAMQDLQKQQVELERQRVESQVATQRAQTNLAAKSFEQRQRELAVDLSIKSGGLVDFNQAMGLFSMDPNAAAQTLTTFARINNMPDVVREYFETAEAGNVTKTGGRDRTKTLDNLAKASVYATEMIQKKKDAADISLLTAKLQLDQLKNLKDLNFISPDRITQIADELDQTAVQLFGYATDVEVKMGMALSRMNGLEQFMPGGFAPFDGGFSGLDMQTKFGIAAKASKSDDPTLKNLGHRLAQIYTSAFASQEQAARLRERAGLEGVGGGLQWGKIVTNPDPTPPPPPSAPEGTFLGMAPGGNVPLAAVRPAMPGEDEPTSEGPGIGGAAGRRGRGTAGGAANSLASGFRKETPYKPPENFGETLNLNKDMDRLGTAFSSDPQTSQNARAWILNRIDSPMYHPFLVDETGQPVPIVNPQTGKPVATWQEKLHVVNYIEKQYGPLFAKVYLAAYNLGLRGLIQAIANDDFVMTEAQIRQQPEAIQDELMNVLDQAARMRK